MKNILLVINIILLGLVGYLYFLHFQNKKGNVTQEVKSAAPGNLTEKSRVAYIDLDSLQNNYTYYKKSRLRTKTIFRK